MNIWIDLANSPNRVALEAYMQAVLAIGERNGIPVCDHYGVWQRYAQTEGKQLFYLLNDPVHPGHIHRVQRHDARPGTGDRDGHPRRT